MKTIKINVIGFFKNFNPLHNFLLDSVNDLFDFKLSDDPDFVLCGPFPPFFGYLKNDKAVRIFFSNENMCPDFNNFDYWIGHDDLIYGDRFLFFPVYLQHNTYYRKFNVHKCEPPEALAVINEKTRFCDFIYGHDIYQGMRGKLLSWLSSYKRVDCAGSLYNNQADGFIANYHDLDTKIEFQRKCKFSLAIDSAPEPDFVTEKFYHSLQAQSIPIYYGTPTIAKYVNEKRIIDLHSFPNLDEALARIKQIDNDDKLYQSILCEEPFIEKDFVKHRFSALRDFLIHIFSQEPSCARRRPRNLGINEWIQDELISYVNLRPTLIYKGIRRLEKRKRQSKKN